MCVSQQPSNPTDELSWSLLEGMVCSLTGEMRHLFVPSAQRPNGKFGIITTDEHDEILENVDAEKVDILFYNRITREMVRMT